MITPEQLATYPSGLAVMQAILSGELPEAPMAKTAGFWLSEVAEGHIVFSGLPKKEFNNPFGTVHGGWPALLLDSAMAAVVHSVLKKGEAFTTVEFKVNLVRPIFESTGVVACTAKVISRGRRIATSEGRITDANGKLMAHGTETCIIMPAEAS